MIAELKACPFCGSEAKWISGGPGCAYVKCNECPAETGDGSIPRIATAWNRRTYLTPPAADYVAGINAAIEMIATKRNEQEPGAMFKVLNVLLGDLEGVRMQHQRNALATRPASPDTRVSAFPPHYDGGPLSDDYLKTITAYFKPDEAENAMAAEVLRLRAIIIGGQDRE